MNGSKKSNPAVFDVNGKMKILEEGQINHNLGLPRHVAIIMDGNGRWAKRRLLPRVAGHQQGVESLRAVIKAAAQKHIEVLTLYAFSSENWQRPKPEVDFLLNLFLNSLQKETKTLHENNIRIRFIGDRRPFSEELKRAMQASESLTSSNTGLLINIALNYGARWDIVNATRLICERVLEGELSIEQITENTFNQSLSLAECIPPDLLIRTSGEQRISNFLLWDIAYSELYFTETLWPDFREAEFELALQAFSQRQRRFGHTPEQAASEVNLRPNTNPIEYCANA